MQIKQQLTTSPEPRRQAAPVLDKQFSQDAPEGLERDAGTKKRSRPASKTHAQSLLSSPKHFPADDKIDQRLLSNQNKFKAPLIRPQNMQANNSSFEQLLETEKQKVKKEQSKLARATHAT